MALTGPVLITGAGGFIGTRLAARIAGDGLEVRTLDIAGSAQFRVDLRDAEAVAEAASGAATILHLGGMVSVSDCHGAPAQAFSVNVLGTQNVLEAARLRGVRNVAMLSTAHVYGAPRYLPVDENHPVAPRSIYAATKLAADAMARAYAESYGMTVSVLRTFNVYGPGQRADAVVATIARQAARSRDVAVRSLAPRRDFVYVDDLIEALVAAAAPDSPGGEFVVASERPVSIAWLAGAALNAAWGPGAPGPVEPPDGGDSFYGTAARARATLGWAPRIVLEEGIARTVRWWRERYEEEGAA